MFEFSNHYKVTFSQQEYVQIFPLPSLSKTCVLLLDFTLERDPKNIFYYQCDIENYMNEVLNFFLFDRHEYIHTVFWSVLLASILMGLFNFFFFLHDLIDRIDSYFQRIASYWLLTFYVTNFF